MRIALVILSLVIMYHFYALMTHKRALFSLLKEVESLRRRVGCVEVDKEKRRR